MHAAQAQAEAARDAAQEQHQAGAQEDSSAMRALQAEMRDLRQRALHDAAGT